jgi:hypothetical protein
MSGGNLECASPLALCGGRGGTRRSARVSVGDWNACSHSEEARAERRGPPVASVRLAKAAGDCRTQKGVPSPGAPSAFAPARSVAADGRRRARFGCSIALQSCAGCITRSSGELRYDQAHVGGYRGGLGSQFGRKMAFCRAKDLILRTANVFFRPPNVRKGVANVRKGVAIVRKGVAIVWRKVANVWMRVRNVRMRVANVWRKVANVWRRMANVSSGVANAFSGLANVRRDGGSVFFCVANHLPSISGQSASWCGPSVGVSRCPAGVAALVKARAGFSRGRAGRTGGCARALTSAATVFCSLFRMRPPFPGGGGIRPPNASPEAGK